MSLFEKMSKPSLGEIISWSGIPNISVLDVPILSAYYDDIADCISEWKSVARKCEVDTDKIDADSSSKTKDKIVQFLTTWKLRKSNNATFKVLATILWDSDYADDARKLCDLFKSSISKNIHQSELPQHSRTESHSSSYTSEEEIDFAHGDNARKRLPSDSVSGPPSQRRRLESSSSDNFSEEEVDHLQSTMNLESMEVLSSTTKLPGTSLREITFPGLQLDPNHEIDLAQLKQESNQMIQDFDQLCQCFSNHVKTSGIDLDPLKLVFKRYIRYGTIYEDDDYDLTFTDVKRIKSITQIMDAAASYSSFFNFSLLESAINEIDFIEGKRLMKIYKEKFEVYASHRIIICPAGIGMKGENHTSLKVVLDKAYFKCRVEHLHQLQADICKIFDINPQHLQVERLEPGSICVIFHILLSVKTNVFPLTDSQINSLTSLQYMGAHIQKIMCDQYVYEIGKQQLGKDNISKSLCYLESGYNELKFKIRQLLQERNIGFKDFVEKASCHFPADIGHGVGNVEDYFEKAQDFGGLSMLHYSLLEETLKLIFGIGDEHLLHLLNEYEVKLTNFLTTTKITEFLKSKDKEKVLFRSRRKKSFDIHEKFCYQRLDTSIKITIEEKSLQYVLDLWKSLQKWFCLTPATVVLEDIKTDCIEIAWLVPEEVVAEILSQSVLNAKDYFCAEKIRIMRINGECIYHEDIHAKEDEVKAQFCLAQACETGRSMEVKAMLEAPKVDINFPNVINGKTPLMLAAQEGYIEIVGTLLKHKASPNIKEDTLGWSALSYAARMGHKLVVEKLLEKGSDILMTDKNGSTVLDVVQESSAIFQYISEVTKEHHLLLKACEIGDLYQVSFLVARKIMNVDTRREDGKTPLMLAAEHGFAEIIQCLLSREPNVLISDDHGAIAADLAKDFPDALDCLSVETMMAAAAKGKVGVIQRMLDLKIVPDIKETDKYGYTALLWACTNGHLEVVQLLLQNGADPTAESKETCWNGLLLACRYRHYDIVKILLQQTIDVNKKTADGWTALMIIASNGNTEIAELLLDHQAKPELEDKKGFIPLIQAAQNGHYEIVKLLVERNPQIEVDKYRTKDPNNWSAVMFATKNGHTRIVKYLVGKGADLHRQKKDGITVLHIAAYKGHKDLVRYFCLNQKLNVDAQDEDGMTPLMYAAKAGNLDVVKSLLQTFAKINIPENDINWTAPFFAVQAKHQSIVDFFLKCNIDLYHRDSMENNLMHLSLLFNREAYRSIKAISTEEATEFEKSTKFVKSEEYSYIEKFYDKWNKNFGASLKFNNIVTVARG